MTRLFGYTYSYSTNEEEKADINQRLENNLGESLQKALPQSSTRSKIGRNRV